MPSRVKVASGCLSSKPRLTDRPLLPTPRAVELAGVFKILANGTRLRLLHALVRSGELSVTRLAETLGMKPQAVSNQLQRMVDRGILAFQRNGNSVHYRVVDPCVPALLDRGLCLVEDGRQRARQAVRR